jgi:magnesium and cobalt transporter
MMLKAKTIETMTADMSDTAPQDDSDPGSVTHLSPAYSEIQDDKGGFLAFVKGMFFPKPDSSLREAIEDAIEEDSFDDEDSVSAHERALLSNVLELKDKTVSDVVIPRADIVAIDARSTHDELMNIIGEKQFSRFPVFEENMDNMIGTVHIKDLIGAMARDETLDLRALVREIPIVSPSMPVLDMLLSMQQSHKHMAFVVDEYGGIDGLVTIGEVVESIVGDIEDEYDPNTTPQMEEQDDDSVIADARLDVEEFEDRYGEVFSEDERNESDTLGGIVFDAAGRIPARGEIIKHKKTGMRFEVLEADALRIHKIRIHNIPSS